jgi:hypothetical protein
MMPGDDELTDSAMLDPDDLLDAARAESLEDLLWALQMRGAMHWSAEQLGAYILSALVSTLGAARAAQVDRDAAQQQLAEARQTIETLTRQLGRARRLPRWLRWIRGIR